jgi:hypothetical protein
LFVATRPPSLCPSIRSETRLPPTVVDSFMRATGSASPASRGRSSTCQQVAHFKEA